MMDLLESQISVLKLKIKKERDESMAIQVDEQVPSVGELTAVGDASRFSSMEKVEGFLGFTPRIDSSGDKSPSE